MDRVVVSWSGGKDCCFALDKVSQQGCEVAGLLVTVPQEQGTSFGHGLAIERIEAQAKALGLPLYVVHCTYDSYTEDFVAKLKEIKEQGITGVVFGDLYLEGHREWGEKVAKEVGIDCFYPLWMDQKESAEAIHQFVESGYEAIICRLRPELLDKEWLGQRVDKQFAKATRTYPICPMGEAGEYHTYVIGGPLFTNRIEIKEAVVREMETTVLYDILKVELIEKG